MNSKSHVIKFISWFMSIVFVLLGFSINLEAKELKDYDIHTYKSRQRGASFTYKKNDDGENTITLLSIASVSRINNVKIISPIDSYEVTRVADNFSYQSGCSKVWKPFFRTLSANAGVFFKNLGRGFMEVVLTLTPFINIFYLAARGANPNMAGYQSFESYKVETSNIFPVEEINLPQCVEIGENAFANCWQLKRVNLPKCEHIGDQTFNLYYTPDEMCISKNINLQSCWTNDFLQRILDKGGILKYIDENGQEVRVHSLGEFPNFDKYQKVAH